MSVWRWIGGTLLGLWLATGVFGASGRSTGVVACLFPLLTIFPFANSEENNALAWPQVRQESRLWTYWWWLGSAVTKEEITRHIELFKQAGLG